MFPEIVLHVPLIPKNIPHCSPQFYPSNGRRISGRRFSPSEFIFRRKRSDDRKYVCCSQVTTISLTFHFHFRLLERGSAATILRKYLTEGKFADRKTALQQRNKSACKNLLPFVSQYHPTLPSLKRIIILMGKWHLIQNQQRLREMFKKAPPYLIARENLLRTH